MSIEKHKAFLDSLEGEKGLPEEMHGIRFDADLMRYHVAGVGVENYMTPVKNLLEIIEYLAKRCERAESRQIPNLKEKVKAFGIACMNAEKDSYETDGSVDFDAAGKRVEELRALFAPEVKP